MDLEEPGLIESTLCFRVTQQGLEELPDGHQRPRVAGTASIGAAMTDSGAAPQLTPPPCGASGWRWTIAGQ